MRIRLDGGLLDDTLLRAKDDIVVVDVVGIVDALEVDDGGNLVALLNLEQVLDGAALGDFLSLRNLEHPHPEALATFGKEQQVVVVGGHVEVFDEVLVAGAAATGALTTAVLHLVLGQRRALDVAEVRDGDDHLLVGDGVLHAELGRAVLDGRTALVTEAFLDVLQLVLDDAHAQVHVVEHVVEVGDELHQLVVLVLQFLAFHAGELAQTHLHDGLGLDLGEIPLLHKSLPSLLHGLRGADEGDNLVDDVEGLEEAFEDVSALLSFLKIVAGAADDHLVAVLHVLGNHVLKVQGHGAAVDKGHVVDAERRLQGGHLV